MNWNDYKGQEKLKHRLQVHIGASITLQHRMDHVLLIAPPGYGKTTLARLIGQELNTNYLETICPFPPSYLKKVVSAFNGVWFLDEIHKLTAKQQEEMLPLLQEGYIQPNGGQRIKSGWLCIVGATTEPDKLIAPLHDRFRIRPAFEEYSEEEMGEIVKGMFGQVGIQITDENAIKFGRATGGVPRLANDFSVMARDLQTNDFNTILEMLNVTEDGLTTNHIDYLNALAECGGIAGLELLKAYLRLPPTIIRDIERLLLKKGYVEYTKQGRSLTGLAYNVLDISFL